MNQCSWVVCMRFPHLGAQPACIGTEKCFILPPGSAALQTLLPSQSSTTGVRTIALFQKGSKAREGTERGEFSPPPPGLLFQAGVLGNGSTTSHREEQSLNDFGPVQMCHPKSLGVTPLLSRHSDACVSFWAKIQGTSLFPFSYPSNLSQMLLRVGQGREGEELCAFLSDI